MEKYAPTVALCCIVALLVASASAGPYPLRPYGYGAVRSYYYSGAPVAPYAVAPYAAAPLAAAAPVAPYAAAAVVPDYYAYAASAALSYPGYGYGYGYPYLGAYAGYPYVKK